MQKGVKAPVAAVVLGAIAIVVLLSSIVIYDGNWNREMLFNFVRLWKAGFYINAFFCPYFRVVIFSVSRVARRRTSFDKKIFLGVYDSLRTADCIGVIFDVGRTPLVGIYCDESGNHNSPADRRDSPAAF